MVGLAVGGDANRGRQQVNEEIRLVHTFEIPGHVVFIMMLLLSVTVVIDLSEKIDNLLIIMPPSGSGYPVRAVFYALYHFADRPIFHPCIGHLFTSQLAGDRDNCDFKQWHQLLPNAISIHAWRNYSGWGFYLGNNYFVPWANNGVLPLKENMLRNLLRHAL